MTSLFFKKNIISVLYKYFLQQERLLFWKSKKLIFLTSQCLAYVPIQTCSIFIYYFLKCYDLRFGIWHYKYELVGDTSTSNCWNKLCSFQWDIISWKENRLLESTSSEIPILKFSTCVIWGRSTVLSYSHLQNKDLNIYNVSSYC